MISVGGGERWGTARRMQSCSLVPLHRLTAAFRSGVGWWRRGSFSPSQASTNAAVCHHHFSQRPSGSASDLLAISFSQGGVGQGSAGRRCCSGLLQGARESQVRWKEQGRKLVVARRHTARGDRPSDLRCLLITGLILGPVDFRQDATGHSTGYIGNRNAAIGTPCPSRHITNHKT